MIIISDAHVGTSMWQYEILNDLGYDVRISTYSNHKKYLTNQRQFDSVTFRFLHVIPKFLVRIIFKSSRNLRKVKLVICSFPPLRVKDFLKLPENVSILLNIGHRFHIHFKHFGFSDLIEVNEFFRSLQSFDRVLVTSMSLYDYHYYSYYLGFDPVERLLVSVKPVQQSSLSISNNRTILVGPSHNLNKLVLFDSIEHLNQLSAQYSKKYNAIPYEFKFIKNQYKNANIEKILSHPAVIIIPYSAFSISMVEIVQSGVPVIVPANSLLIDEMNDVRLSPIYADKNQVEYLDSKHTKLKNIKSPNSHSHQAQNTWLNFMYFNNVSNIQKFNSIKDFFEIIYTSDFDKIRQTNIVNNQIIYEEQKHKWKNIISNLY